MSFGALWRIFMSFGALCMSYYDSGLNSSFRYEF